ncbi:RHS repeat-associated core domain-containing protein [Streptomyces sp. NPDC044984]|uniref:RHS repeat-associated core domain-containing protein n=1 Tax=Streptomyces sp. NPDC044984 TaxID=3154335 RepID=UPI003401E619
MLDVEAAEVRAASSGRRALRWLQRVTTPPDRLVDSAAGQLLHDQADDGTLDDGQRTVAVEPGGPAGQPQVQPVPRLCGGLPVEQGVRRRRPGRRPELHDLSRWSRGLAGTHHAAWGATQWNSDATAYTPLRYPGQYFDPETGLHYNVHRYYDPQTGRYISPDPLGLAPAPNHYTYVPHPFTTADPLGLTGCFPDHTWGGRVVFVQDEHGRPSETHATVTRDMLDEGTNANNSPKPPGFLHGTDHNQARGHMLARMLGGTGDHLDNLFTIAQNPTNTPHMRDLEQQIYNAVTGDPAQNIAGRIVQYSVHLEYTDDRTDSVPPLIHMQADGSNGYRLDTDSANPDHAAQQNRHRQGIP